MNNILFIISDLDRGGAQRVLTKIANHISKKFKVRILTLHRQKKLNFYISPKIEIIKLNFVIRSELHKKIVDYFKLINIIRGKLKIYQPNRIISFINTTNIITIISSFGFHSRLIISERNDLHHQYLPFFWKFLRYFTYKLPKIISANSKNCINQLNEFVENKKLFYLPNPVIFPANIKKVKNKVILAVGRLTYQKGFDILIKAFKKSEVYKYGWKLEIYGDGHEKLKLKRLIKNLNLTKFADINNHNKAIEKIYSKSTIFILSSRFEGTPNVLLEAISFKVPCIISDNVKSAFEFLEHNKSCIKFKNENIMELSNSITLLSRENLIRKKISEKAYKILRKNFSSKKVFKVWEKVLE